MAKLKGFTDGELHQNIPEALKALERAQEAYDHALKSIDGQYLRSIDEAFSDQVAAVRALFNAHEAEFLANEPVRARQF